jgi:hypothetical protein
MDWRPPARGPNTDPLDVNAQVAPGALAATRTQTLPLTRTATHARTRARAHAPTVAPARCIGRVTMLPFAQRPLPRSVRSIPGRALPSAVAAAGSHACVARQVCVCLRRTSVACLLCTGRSFYSVATARASTRARAHAPLRTLRSRKHPSARPPLPPERTQCRTNLATARTALARGTPTLRRQRCPNALPLAARTRPLQRGRHGGRRERKQPTWQATSGAWRTGDTPPCAALPRRLAASRAFALPVPARFRFAASPFQPFAAVGCAASPSCPPCCAAQRARGARLPAGHATAHRGAASQAIVQLLVEAGADVNLRAQ